MNSNIINRPFLVEQFNSFNKWALKNATDNEIVDVAEAYLAATSSTTNALLIVADTVTPTDGQVKLSTVNSVTTGFNVGDYVVYRPKVSHIETTYTDKYVKTDGFSNLFDSYTDTEIENMFDGTTEEIKYYKSIIADDKVSKYYIWSSKNTSDKIAASVVEANTYTDGLISGLANVQLKYVTALPDIGQDNIIYILDTASSGSYPTLNLYDSDTSTWKMIGSFKVDMNEFYTKNDIDTKLNNYMKTTEGLNTDDVETVAIDFSKDPWE